ncbi:hypothetical protein EZS27_032020, partial [termite gut metagenome]
MKKNVVLLLFALCFPMIISAQSNDDDIYYVPGKNKKAEKVVVEKKVGTTTVYATPASTIVVQNSKEKVRNVDEYNRRYDASDFVSEEDTFYVNEKEKPDLNGEWVNGFDGSQDDYEYAERIIRFRNPRYAAFISSPYYWDIAYGANSWNGN